MDPVVRLPNLMIYGNRDMVAKSQRPATLAPGVEVVNLDCGHWIQQERPQETNEAVLGWLSRGFFNKTPHQGLASARPGESA